MTHNPQGEGTRPLSATLLGVGALTLQPLILNVLSVPVIAYIINRLGPEQYGQWMVAVSLLAVFGIVTNLGLRSAFVRAIAATPSGVGDLFAEQLGLRFILAALAGLLVTGVCVLLGYPEVVVWCVVIGAVGLMLATIATTLGDTLQATGRIKTLAGVNFAAGIALIVASLAAAWSGAGPILIAAAYLVGPTTSALVMMIVVRRHVCGLGIRCDLGRCSGLLRESRFLAAQQLLLSGTSQAEMLLLPKLIGLASFGQFSAGALPANRMVVLPDALCAIAFPEMVRAWQSEHGRRSLARLVLNYMFITLILCAGLALIGALLAHPIAGILFPKSPSIIAEIIRITVWCLPLLGVELVLGYALTAAGRDAIQARLAVHASVLSLTACVGLVSTLGLEGACWSMLMRPAIRAAMLAPAVIHLLNDTSSPGLVTSAEPVQCVELRDAA